MLHQFSPASSRDESLKNISLEHGLSQWKRQGRRMRCLELTYHSYRDLDKEVR